MGCPIRTPRDQSLLAAHPGFSQRATSFIASWRQGIHQMPFSHSNPTLHRNNATTCHITPIKIRPNHYTQTPLNTAMPITRAPLARDDRSDKHANTRRTSEPTQTKPPQPRYPDQASPELSYAPRDAPEPDSHIQRPTPTPNTHAPPISGHAHIRRRTSYPPRHKPNATKPKPPSRPPYPARSQTAPKPGDDRDRTDDPLLAKQVLSQLSYAPMTIPANLA